MLFSCVIVLWFLIQFNVQAARDNSIEIVEEWIEFLSSKGNEEMVNTMNERDEHGMAAIHYAAKFNRFKILVRLHEHCAGNAQQQ